VKGKQVASRNSVTHGALSPNPVAGGESTEEWLEFLDGMRVHFEPIGTYERELVDRIAIDLWSLRRVARTVTAIISLRHQAIDKTEPATNVTRYVEDDPKRVDFGDGPRHVGYAATSFCAG
jgi:hypothetical protein